MRPCLLPLTALCLSVLTTSVLAEGRIAGQIVNAAAPTTPLASASVSLYRSDTGKLVALGMSDGEGNYNFEGVPAGKYSIGVTATDFRPFRRQDLPVRDDRTLRVNFELLPVEFDQAVPAAGSGQ